MSEKIGVDILGYQSMPRMSEKKKKELEAKVKEELAKKQKDEKEEQKLPDLPIPNDQHTPKPGEHGWDKVAEEAKEQVHVNEHVRGRPKKKKKQAVEVI